MSDLKKQLIKLGSTNPELRPHIRPVMASLDKVANLNATSSLEFYINAVKDEFILLFGAEFAKALGSTSWDMDKPSGGSSNVYFTINGKYGIDGHYMAWNIELMEGNSGYTLSLSHGMSKLGDGETLSFRDGSYMVGVSSPRGTVQDILPKIRKHIANDLARLQTAYAR